jgi:hypothetical protein
MTDVSQVLERPPRGLLAHYTKMDTAANYILKRRSIRFGALGTVNDPREFRERMNHLLYRGNEH